MKWLDIAMPLEHNTLFSSYDGGRLAQVLGKVTRSDLQAIVFWISWGPTKMRLSNSMYSLNISHLQQPARI